MKLIKSRGYIRICSFFFWRVIGYRSRGLFYIWWLVVDGGLDVSMVENDIIVFFVGYRLEIFSDVLIGVEELGVRIEICKRC